MKLLGLNIALLLCVSIAVKAQTADPVKQKLATWMMNQPAPVFKLKDGDGKDVALADLKGKIVVVDFWATWCGPCKMSFPATQLSVDQFKNDKDVVFLFIDTRENESNYRDLVKTFLTDNHYTFHVLFDENDPDGKQNLVYQQYGTPGLPTKFVIDKDGIIRFKLTGYFPGESDQNMTKLVAAMIDIAKQPQLYAGK